jgi:hypothetical protein
MRLTVLLIPLVVQFRRFLMPADDNPRPQLSPHGFAGQVPASRIVISYHKACGTPLRDLNREFRLRIRRGCVRSELLHLRHFAINKIYHPAAAVLHIEPGFGEFAVGALIDLFLFRFTEAQ